MFVYELIDLDAANVLMRKDIFHYDEIQLFDPRHKRWVKSNSLIQRWDRWINYHESVHTQLSEEEAKTFIQSLEPT